MHITKQKLKQKGCYILIIRGKNMNINNKENNDQNVSEYEHETDKTFSTSRLESPNISADESSVDTFEPDEDNLFENQTNMDNFVTMHLPQEGENVYYIDENNKNTQQQSLNFQ